MRIPAPESSKIWEWLAQIIILAAVAFSSYKLLEYRVSRLEKSDDQHATYLTKEDFKEFKRTWGFVSRNEARLGRGQ